MFAKMNKNGISSTEFNSPKQPAPVVASKIVEIERNKKLTGMQKDILEKLSDPNRVLTESDVNYIKNTINRSFSGSKENPEFEDELKDLVWNNENGFRLTDEQTEKGKKYLMKHYKNRMGYREQHVMDDFKEFRLIGWYDAGNIYRKFYIPYYRVIAKDGSTFEYHVGGSDGFSITGWNES